MATQNDLDWRQTDDIVECNRQMLERQYACDVHFLVGEGHERQGAHKYVLISRSQVFAAMFCGSLPEGVDKAIDVPDVEATAFAELLRYIYTGTSQLNASNVLPVLYAANKYDVTGLASACVGYVEKRLDVDNACALLEQAHLFEEKTFHSRVLELILRKGEEVLNCHDVSELCHQCLGDVVGADNLICQEVQVFDALDRWASQECVRRGLECTDDNKRILLGPVIYQVRLPLLQPEVFVDKVVSRSLLSEEEKVDVMRHFLVPAKGSSFFKCQPRKKQKHRRFNRFENRHSMAWNNKSGKSAISFMTNHDVFVEGFTLYGTCRSGSHVLTVQGQLLDSTGNVLASVNCEVFTDNNVDIYDVMFDDTRQITRDTWYTLAVNITGTHTYAGQNGRMSVFDGDVVFTFSSTDKSETGTGIEQGQLPGILFTL